MRLGISAATDSLTTAGSRTHTLLRDGFGELDTIELLTSIGHPPSDHDLASVAELPSNGFLFAVAIRDVEPDVDGLNGVAELLGRLRERLDDLLGPILLEIEDHGTSEALVGFLDELPDFDHWTLEVPSRLRTPGVLSFLRTSGIGLCLSERRDGAPATAVTAPHVYAALREPTTAHRGRWDEQSIVGWACALAAWLDDAREVFCYLDVTDGAATLDDLRTLRRMVSGPSDDLDCP